MDPKRRRSSKRRSLLRPNLDSIVLQKFSVHWQDHGWSIPTATFIKLDGYTVPGHFLMGTGHAERSNIRVGLTTVRPFMFQRVPERE